MGCSLAEPSATSKPFPEPQSSQEDLWAKFQDGFRKRDLRHLRNMETKGAPETAATTPPLPEPVISGGTSSTEGAAKPVGKSPRFRLKVAASATVLVAVATCGWFFVSRKTRPLTDKDTIVLADFTNSTNEAIFDDTLKTALTLSLRQSPFLNALSDGEVAKTLQIMTLPANTKLTPEVAREICQRTGSRLTLQGRLAVSGANMCRV